MFNVVFTQAARAELLDAQDWYEGEAAGLGRRFRTAINAAVELHERAPAAIPHRVQEREPRTAPVATAHLTNQDSRCGMPEHAANRYVYQRCFLM